MTGAGEGVRDPSEIADDGGTDGGTPGESVVKRSAPEDWARLTERLGNGLPAQFTQSLTGADSPLTQGIESIRELISAQVPLVIPDFGLAMAKALEPYTPVWRSQMASIRAMLPRFTSSPGFLSAVTAAQAQQKTLVANMRAALRPLIDPELWRRINRSLLPPNLRGHADDIRVSAVQTFLEEEGIPLYLVPRGRTALRLLRADGRAARRRILGECYWTIIDDCAAVLDEISSVKLLNDVQFVRDGIGAMRAGHHRSAQALFTVTLDSLIQRLYPDVNERRAITNHQRGSRVPEAIDEMGVREAFVWLPIWNAHEEFWTKKGHKVPYYYSRHASVHGVSSRQFSKRNCVQVLMLVTSLIGYADRLAKEDN